MKKILALAMFSSFAFADGGVNFNQIELTTGVGASFYDVECIDCGNEGLITSLGLSTDHKSDFFAELMLNNPNVYKFKDSEKEYEYDLESINASLNYNFLNEKDFHVFSGLGVSAWKNRMVSVSNDKTQMMSRSQMGFSPILNLGAKYDITKDIALGIKYEHAFKVEGYNGASAVDFDTDSVFLTLNYRLPVMTEEVVKTEYITNEATVYNEVFKEKIVIQTERFSVYFDLNEHVSEQVGELDKLIENIIENEDKNYILYVNAHASDIGGEAYNDLLSGKRADFVKSVLKEKLIESDLKVQDKIIAHKYGTKYHSEDSSASQRVDIHISFY